MGNVYNRTSERIKYPTVHLSNACENRSRPFTDAETQHCGEPTDLLSQPEKKKRHGTASWRGKPGCPRKAGADPRHTGGA